VILFFSAVFSASSNEVSILVLENLLYILSDLLQNLAKDS